MSFRTNALLAGFTLFAVALSACGDDDDAALTAASGGKAGTAGASGAAGARAGSGGATTAGTGGTAAGAGGGGTSAGGSAGATAGGSAGATAGGSAGATAGGSAGATAGGSAGATAGGSAGATAGGSAGATAGGSAGTTAGGSAGATAGGAAGTAAGGSAGAGGAVDAPVPNFDALALGPNGDVYRFETNNPAGATKTSAVSAGLGGAPLPLVGIDYRPSDGLLYGATNTTLYVLNAGGLLNPNLVGGSPQTFEPNLGNAGQGFDFNPAANITVDGSGNPLRIVGYADASNSRYNPTNGKRLGADAKLTYAAPATGEPQVAGSAYTNNVKGVTTTALYALDGRTDTLVQQDPPNDGILKNIAPLGIDVTDLAGFDIATVIGVDSAAKDYGFAVIGDSLYTIRLTTSTEPAAKLVGKVNGASQLRGLAIALAPK